MKILSRITASFPGCSTLTFSVACRKRRPTKEERYRSSTIVADRLCGAVAEPIVKRAGKAPACAHREVSDRARLQAKAHPGQAA